MIVDVWDLTYKISCIVVPCIQETLQEDKVECGVERYYQFNFTYVDYERLIFPPSKHVNDEFDM